MSVARNAPVDGSVRQQLFLVDRDVRLGMPFHALVFEDEVRGRR